MTFGQQWPLHFPSWCSPSKRLQPSHRAGLLSGALYWHSYCVLSKLVSLRQSVLRVVKTHLAQLLSAGFFAVVVRSGLDGQPFLTNSIG
jgi:hypothetical protein